MLFCLYDARGAGYVAGSLKYNNMRDKKINKLELTVTDSIAYRLYFLKKPLCRLG